MQRLGMFLMQRMESLLHKDIGECVMFTEWGFVICRDMGCDIYRDLIFCPREELESVSSTGTWEYVI